MSERISFTPIILRHQKPTEVKECFIELQEKVIRCFYEFTADETKDENDESLGTNNDVKNYFDTYALKRNVAGVELSLTTDLKWGVFVIVSGFAKDIKVYFKSKTKAEEMKDKILEWLLK